MKILIEITLGIVFGCIGRMVSLLISKFTRNLQKYAKVAIVIFTVLSFFVVLYIIYYPSNSFLFRISMGTFLASFMNFNWDCHRNRKNRL